MTNRNPFNDILMIMDRKTNEKMPTYFYLGTVTSGDDKGYVVINAGGLEYKEGENELMRAARMRIESGDKVLLISLDGGQKMIILCVVEEV